MHQRTIVRNAIRDVLLDATAAEDRVFTTRVVPMRTLNLPAISVYILSEPVDPDSVETAPRELTRTPDVLIEGWVEPGENVDDAIDALALEIETAMHADPYLGGAVAESILSNTDMEVIETGKRLVGFLAMSYAVEYQTDAPEAPNDLDEFETAHATYNLGNDVHEDDEAEDLFTVKAS